MIEIYFSENQRVANISLKGCREYLVNKIQEYPN